MPYAEVNDIRMYYEEHGEGDPLILLHGATGAIGYSEGGWDDHVATFAVRYRTIQIENRGHGRTTNPAGRLSYGQYTDDLAEFIKALELAPAHIVGLSDGGIVGLTLGMTRPDLVRSLVAVGTNFRIDDQVKILHQVFDAEVIEHEDPGWVEAMVAFHDTHHGPGYWRELVRQHQAMFDVEPAYSEDDLRRIDAPTLLISGELDPFGNLDQTLMMRQCIPNSEMLILNHAGMNPFDNHLIQHTRADVVGPVVVEFLARQEGR